MDADTHRFGSDGLTVVVAAAGAEPVSIRTPAGRELLWQAGPQWPRHAPILFPIVGRLAGDALRHAGQALRMTQHGFARDRRFGWDERAAQGCRLVLEDDARSRLAYPFAFRLEVEYRVEGLRLDVEYRVRNTGAAMLPAQIGAHPAFRWPLEDGVPKAAHRLVFKCDEPAPVRQVAGGLLHPDPRPSPIGGQVLRLDDALFADDAVILDRVASGSVRFEADGAADALAVAWRGAEQLALWSKPGADFLCIEPWRGLASPIGFDGAFIDKPYLMRLAPGAEAALGWSVALAPG